jgi:protein SCO1/2
VRSFILWLFFVFPLPGWLFAENPIRPEQLTKIGWEQKLGQPLSLGLTFRDEAGANVQLGKYFGKRPVILAMGYYGCPMLCSLVLNGMVESMSELRMDAGQDFDVVFVSIEPKEMPPLAAAKKATYLRRYSRPGAAEGWHFLTGDAVQSAQLAEEIGFGHAWDPTVKQHAHPSGFVIVTPEGTVGRYFFGVTYRAADLDRALREAQENRIGTPIQKLLLLCFHFSPLTGKYGPLVMNGVRAAAILTLLALGAVVFHGNRRKPDKEAGS